MTATRTLRRTGLMLALGLALAACAQQGSTQPQPSAASPAGAQQGMQGHSMSGMSGMNMQQMMAHCTEMRQQMQSGATMSPDMQAMMAHCNQMSPQPGAAAGAGQQRR